jgi:hypothetical protein
MKVNGRFGGTYHLHFWGRIVSQERNRHEAASNCLDHKLHFYNRLFYGTAFPDNFATAWKLLGMLLLTAKSI